MKKIIIFVVCVLSAARLHAQYDKGQHEISVSGGLISGRQIGEAFDAENGPVPSGATPSYFVSYKYFLFYFMAVGVTGGRQTLWETGPDNGYSAPYAVKIINTTFAVEVTFAYPPASMHGGSSRRAHVKESRFVRPYAVLGYGYSFTSGIYTSNPTGAYTNGTTRQPNFQITPIGVRFGRSLAGFIEFGVGYKGIFNGGVAYNIGWNRGSRYK